ncbi:lysylphosphatidylglycerol synthase transmembrane domain-containing protein [Effusibacillus dendaii]|uniref:Phosphatidylglycerol lysyltransferase n=1 Tax=Effusibacillus dendaii TaxID=2743772 RepID=A0A7I8DDD7_9BACL|nr:lysylphosphatidylglycerol synthase transmembrane domain-containing protein [Effusibacillus dendaii]BCJ86826.1 hypothetical protein skT53_18110 [Effusibacillus dendaii]
MFRVLIPPVSFALLGFFLYTQRQELASLPGYFRLVNTPNAVLLGILELAVLLLIAQSNRLVYRSIGVKSRLLDQFQLSLASAAIERLLPSGGTAAISSYILLARNRGITAVNSMKMSATTFVLGYAQIVPLLFVPLIFLGKSGLSVHQSLWIVAISGGFVLLVGAISIMLGSAYFINRLQKWIWVSRRPRLLHALSAAHQHVRFSWRHRRQLLLPLLLLWAIYPLRVTSLSVCFAALQVPVSISTVWIGYSLTILVSFLTFLPTTLGVFELSMVGTFVLLKIPADAATAVTLLYRIFTYWLPFPIGFIAWWNLRRGGVDSQ